MEVKRVKEIVLKYIRQKFIENIKITPKKEENLFTVTLPFYLGSGDPIIVSVRENLNEIILTNGIYKSLRSIFKEKFEDDFEKSILDSKKYKSSVEKNLKAQNIEHTLNLKKKITYIDEENLANEILVYSFCIKNHYDYIYYDLLKKEKKPRQESILSNAISTYVDKFNVESIKKITKIEDFDFVSDKNNYYSVDNVLFSDVTNKVDFLDAKDDMLDMIEEINLRTKRGIILYDRITPKYKVSDDYIEKLRKRLKKKNIVMLEIQDELDIQKLNMEIEKNDEIH